MSGESVGSVGNGQVALERLRNLQATWAERYRDAQHQVEELRERTFIGQSTDRNVRVTVDADGDVIDVHVDRGRLPTLSSEQLATCVLAAEQAARTARDDAHSAITRRMLNVDEDRLKHLTDTLSAADQVDTDRSGGDSPATTEEPEIDDLLMRAGRYRRMNAHFIDEMTTPTATGTNRDRCVRADCTAASALSQLHIDPKILRRPPRNIEHALLQAIQQAQSAATSRREELVEKLMEVGNPLGKILSGGFDPNAAFEPDGAFAALLQQPAQHDHTDEVNR
ncbi:MAG: hypothetical protein GEU97_18215 [Actinophytocola sp.]|nr:hypothetical protein [Actinophytocola sp.]